MKSLIWVIVGIPALFLMLGNSSGNRVETAEMKPVLQILNDQPPKPIFLDGKDDPVLLQIETQDFPFDINGNFPFVVLVDNVIWTYKKEDVREFIKQGTPNSRATGRLRSRSLSQTN
mgnify:FL=1|tara:strand:- start:990 stop:1340 length:351 start_codon:yes stop_codon:yes gene_type:complete